MARKILLADDSVTAQNMGRKILTDAGYEVITVNNGSAALKKIAEGKPDLIVLDVYMPGYSGLEVCQRIKENRDTSRIPILLTVGKLEPFKPEEARRAKADAFVVKPFEASELLSALTKLEDKIIPGAEPYKPGRFAKAIANVEREGDNEQFGDLDEGWKARLRIPTGPHQEAEPPVDYASTQGKGFRDLIEPSGRKGMPKPAAFERQMPAGLPADITPEEIAAITAAAAQLRGAAPAAPAAEPPAESVPEIPAETVATVAESSAAETSDDETAPVTFANAPEVEEVSAPVVEAEAAMDAAPTQAEASAQSSADEAAMVPEVPVPAGEVPADAEPAPVMAESIATEVPAAPPVAQPAEPVATASAGTQESAPQPVAEAAVEAPAATVAVALEPPSVEPVTMAVAEPVTAPPERSEAAPSAATSQGQDDEVMAALHALIPADVTSGASVVLAEVGATSEGAPASSQLSDASTGGPRWVAEEVSLSVEEASLALDHEMEVAATVVQAAAEPVPSVAVETPVVDAVAVAQEPTAQEVPEVYAVATAAGAEFPAPWPVGNSPVPPQAVAEAASAVTAETVAGPAASHIAPTDELRAGTNTEPEGGTEIMAASWKNIRNSIAGSAAKPAPAKEEFADAPAASAEVATFETPHSGSETAPESAPPKTGANDPTAIANIVDSVLAELRPKIVEEIARKLGDPKK